MADNHSSQQPAPFAPSRLAQTDTSRKAAYTAHLNWYDGKQWSTASGQTMQQRRNERRLTLNYVHRIIDRTAGLLLHESSSVISHQDPTAAAAATAAWAAITEANELATLDLETEIDAAILGDAAYKVTWQPERGIVITSPDAQGLYAWWDPDDQRIITAVAQQRTTQDQGRATTYTEHWTARTFQLWVNDQLTLEHPNPYPWIPYLFIHNQRTPKQFWGTSDLDVIQDAAEELNREFTTLSRIMELSGNPIAVLSGVEESDDIAVRQGAVWNLPPDAQAKLLDLLAGGSITAHLDYLTAVYKTLHDLAETPRSAFGDVGRALSGVALELDLLPLVHRVQRKRLARSAIYKTRITMALQLLATHEAIPPGPYTTAMQWGPILPQDDQAIANTNIALTAAGLRSHTTALAQLAVDDPDAEFERITEQTHRWTAATGSRQHPPQANPAG